MATIPSYEVQVHVFGTAVAMVFSDADVNGAGVSAYDALMSHKDINVLTSDGRIFVPFHAVSSALVTITQVKYTKPVDANCPEKSEETGETEETGESQA